MSLFRPSTTFLRSTLRAPQTIRPFSSTVSRFATQGYGDGKGDPAGENNESTSAAQSAGEHPGPDSPASASAQSGGSRSKEAAETGSSPTGGKVGGSDKSKNGAAPKINDKDEPGTDDKEYQKEVEEHNKDFEKRHDRAQAEGEDKVDKKFWKGQGGHTKGT